MYCVTYRKLVQMVATSQAVPESSRSAQAPTYTLVTHQYLSYHLTIIIIIDSIIAIIIIVMALELFPGTKLHHMSREQSKCCHVDPHVGAGLRRCWAKAPWAAASGQAGRYKLEPVSLGGAEQSRCNHMEQGFAGWRMSPFGCRMEDSIGQGTSGLSGCHCDVTSHHAAPVPQLIGHCAENSLSNLRSAQGKDAGTCGSQRVIPV